MEGFWISSAIHAIKALSYVYDLLTFPMYLILQRPWEKRKASRRTKARPISKDETTITYRGVDGPGPMHISLKREKIETLDRVLLWAINLHGDKRCLGTRQILAEEDEVQPNGRVFKKVSCYGFHNIEVKLIKILSLCIIFNFLLDTVNL